MPRNPYTLVFGREPLQMISRGPVVDEVVEEFEGEPPSQQVFMISGVRGSGKTVLMTEIANRLRKDDQWVVVELNPERDMLQTLASKLSSENDLARIFEAAKINLSLFGFGLEVHDVAPIADIEVALDKMLASLGRRGKKVLVTVDEVSSSQNMKVFASAFQILVRQGHPIFLIMTGLFANIRRLQDEQGLTFLYRAPRIETKPLNVATMARNYQKTFGISDEQALRMARTTKGYPFAFQVLGYQTWRHRAFDGDTLADVRQYLEEYAYEKIWSELSRTDRLVVAAIARAEGGKVADVRAALGMDSNTFSTYRTRLIKAGVVDGSLYGHVSLALPMFDRYAIEHS